MTIAGFSYERMKLNTTLVNSDWTRKELNALYGIDSTVVNPPIIGTFPEIPWSERENSFVCIGRFSPTKDFEKVCRIISLVRSKVPDVHLHIIGTSWQRGYKKKIERLIENAPWITINEDVSRDELTRLISMHRYGIHGMDSEPFGLAVGEMVKGGCIVFVPRKGGPSEIVGADERLLYSSDEEAVQKISNVICNPELQTSLRHALSKRSQLYTKEAFIRKIQQIVDQFPSNQMM
jgi:glycosyltransferase involved in cell wall biosynthesis